ncbi:alpha/beta hydrolase [Pseudomonas soli]|jgi:predicted alpha/beta-hydrolase family hydrolase|uniref:Alpha/beta family hydrolase n=2 Tax=Pseudomonas TaxID=286 RepID=A0A1H9F1M8_9PSED|nr:MULTISPECIES: alpha/beta family hydrolase [Pseudomonas]AUY37108.1 alpha/beta hydrolase [Pseudomonas sp. PONIH3]MDT3713090.1 alpha/beta family hydrolase [Pseudomonas soli]MDT3730426.1 alpha/beta family hydrolase [Pseudomonas soli]MEE1879427.1 alpha/beta family hydrolase [Pseudomonas soli]NBK40277.1 alpha/beta hydrolase [Pseudomonas soli]
MINGQSAGIDGDQWAKIGNVPGLRCDPPQIPADRGVCGCLILAHGAGAPMDSGFMEDMAQRLAGQGVGVVRFEFPYMAERRMNGGKRPPNPQKVLLESWRTVYEQVRRLVAGPLAIGGKSMGGRMASLLADELGADALVCLGYPFYAVGKPEKPRVEHLAGLRTRTLIVQGERDALGNREAVEGYALSPAIEVSWLAAADHDLKPLKASGFSHEQHMQAAAERVAAFLKV